MLVILSACVVAFAFRIRECFVDDAFTGFQYLKNLLDGQGFVFHPGDAPVEGVTNIGWLLLLSPFSTFAEPTVVAKLAGLALVLMTLLLTVCLGRSLAVIDALREDSFGLVFSPVLMLVTSFDYMYFSLAGMETALLAAILVLMACIAMGRPHSILLPLLGAFAFLVHPEAVAVYPCYAILGWLQAKHGAAANRRFVLGGLILAILVGVIAIIRVGYFHDVVPNTFHSKPSSPGLVVQNVYAFLMAQNTNIAFPFTGWLAIPVLLLGYRRLRRSSLAAADMLAAICGVGLAFALYGPPDWTLLPRYFVPYLPATLNLLWAGILEAVGLLLGTAVGAAVALPHLQNGGGSTTATPTSSTATTISGPRIRQTTAATIALALVLTNVFDGQAKTARLEDFPGYVLAGKNLVGPAVWMRDHLPKQATIATRRIGAVAYYSHRKVFDYAYGLIDREAARLVAGHGGRFDTPTDPALASLWRARAPDYLLEDGPILDQIILQARGTRERFSIHGIEYRVIQQFPIGRDVLWVLAERIAR